MPSGALYLNPSSGSRSPAVAEGIRRRADEEGIDLVEVSDGLDIGADIRGRIAAGQRLFIAAGGDGTIHTVVQALVSTEAVLGILPVGTFNHFARDLQIPLDWEAAFEVAVRGKTIQMSVGAVNDHYFLNNMSIGLYPEVAEQREELRHHSKWRAYVKASVAALQKLHHVHLVVDTPQQMQTIKTHIFMVAVNPYDLESFGIVAPRTTLDGGRLSVYWLPYMQKPGLIRVLARYFSGRATPGTDFRSMQTSRLRVQTPHRSVKIGIDGELYELAPPLMIHLLPLSVQVRTPRGAGSAERPVA